MALSILKWLNVIKTFNSDKKFEETYNNIFSDFENQIQLLEKHFSQI